MSETYISVSQINTYIKNIFEAEIMLQNICVFGEIGSFNISNGNAYFNLKDSEGILQCVLFGANKFDTPIIGDMVLVRGSISYYSKGGRLSFNAYSIMPYGKGLLYEKFMKLKLELEQRGYFNVENKKTIPERVKRIGVVSSPTGAVIRDIIDVTTRRNDTIDIVLYPVKVQGVGAEREIATGIDFFSDYNVDVVIVARGGGSMEDLEPFNSELVATATYNCNKPIVSAVGHETDVTIIDFVADLRAPTPSAAAELVSWDKNIIYENLNNYLNLFVKLLYNRMSILEKDLSYKSDLMNSRFNLITIRYENILNNKINKLLLFENMVDNKIHYIDKLNTLLNSLNPIKISQMGYCRVMKSGKNINSVFELEKEVVVDISMIDGSVNAKVIGRN